MVAGEAEQGVTGSANRESSIITSYNTTSITRSQLVAQMTDSSRSILLERHLAAEGVHRPLEQRDGQRSTVEHLANFL